MRLIKELGPRQFLALKGRPLTASPVLPQNKWTKNYPVAN